MTLAMIVRARLMSRSIAGDSRRLSERTGANASTTLGNADGTSAPVRSLSRPYRRAA